MSRISDLQRWLLAYYMGSMLYLIFGVLIIISFFNGAFPDNSTFGIYKLLEIEPDPGFARLVFFVFLVLGFIISVFWGKIVYNLAENKDKTDPGDFVWFGVEKLAIFAVLSAFYFIASPIYYNYHIIGSLCLILPPMIVYVVTCKWFKEPHWIRNNKE